MQQAATLRDAAVPRRGLLVDGALVTAGALLVALAAQVRIPLGFSPVPITGQTLAVLLVGASLGSVRGGISLLLYVALGAAGLPFYAGGQAGWAHVAGATGGYLVGFAVAAALAGRLAERGWDRRLGSSIGAMLTGNVAVYLVGLPWLSAALGTGLGRTLELGLYPFVPGDLLKVCLAAAALPGAWRIVGRSRR